MKTMFLKSIGLLAVFFHFFQVNSQSPVDPAATLNAKCVLNYLQQLHSNPTAKVLSGQWMNCRGLPETPDSENDSAITALYNQTNKWVGIMGTEYMRQITGPPYRRSIENLKPVNQPLIDYAKQNGIVTVMSSFKNPWTNNNQNDLTGSMNLLEITQAGHPANTAFNKELDSIALGFQQLQDSGVTVLYRPFHENNATWFWWGSKSTTLPVASDFTTLWQYVFTYFTQTKNLHNILWFYTPSARESTVSDLAFKSELFYYPGDAYVDVIGLDVYNDTLDIPNYNALVATGKPLGLAEFGPKKQHVTDIKDTYDYTMLMDQIKTKYPELCFWISYNHFKAGTSSNWVYYSLISQSTSAVNLLNDSWVANRDDIDYSACTTVAIDQLEKTTATELTIYPNPTDSEIQFSIYLDQFSITNGLGQEIMQAAGNSLNTAELANGIYFLKTPTTSLKFVVAH